MTILGISLEKWLGLAVFGAFVSAIGSLLGIFIKDYLFARSFEKWKEKQLLNKIYDRYRDPLFLSAYDLATRILEITQRYPTTYLKREILNSNPDRQIHNSIHDPYFQKHKLISTIYRLSAFLGWLELYRQEVTYLRSIDNEHSRSLEKVVNSIRSDLADGQINSHENKAEWRDTLVFRDELRAIGESMIERSGNVSKVVGYGHYLEAIETSIESRIKRWSPVVSNFLTDLENDGKDFRKIRIDYLLAHLIDIMALLKASEIDEKFFTKRKQLKSLYPKLE